MENTESDKGNVSSAQAVLLGALAPGVNGPTWITLKSSFLMLGLCLVVVLGLAFSSSDSSLMLHVAFLVLICVSLFLLLSWFLAETGLVSVEHQMREMGLAPRVFDELLHEPPSNLAVALHEKVKQAGAGNHNDRLLFNPKFSSLRN
ncbi:hypothetical protein K1719_008261 [Acacia pycnantha]|nr:hypothetical protein K1719_008261 [Acacia pycnantha]